MRPWAAALRRRRVSNALPSFDFTALAPGAVVLPKGLALVRASSATVQTGLSTMQTAGIGNDVARIGQRTDSTSTRGLVIEPRRTNLVTIARAFTGGTWSSVGAIGAFTPNVATSPDGVADADQFQTAAGNYGPYHVRTVAVGDGTVQISGWGRAVTAPFTSTTQFGLASSNFALTTSWQRFSNSYPSAGAGTYYVGPNNAGGVVAQNTYWVCYCIEVGGYVTEWIPAGETREADEYTITKTIAHNGRVTVEIVHIPKGTLTTYSSDPYTLHGSATDYVRVDTATGVVTLASGGSAYTTELGVVITRYDSVRWYFELGTGGAPLAAVQVNSDEPLLLSIGDPAELGAWTATTCGLMHNAGADVFACWLRTIEFFAAQGAWT